MKTFKTPKGKTEEDPEDEQVSQTHERVDLTL